MVSGTPGNAVHHGWNLNLLKVEFETIGHRHRPGLSPNPWLAENDTDDVLQMNDDLTKITTVAPVTTLHLAAAGNVIDIHCEFGIDRKGTSRRCAHRRTAIATTDGSLPQTTRTSRKQITNARPIWRRTLAVIQIHSWLTTFQKSKEIDQSSWYWTTRTKLRIPETLLQTYSIQEGSKRSESKEQSSSGNRQSGWTA